MNCPELRPKHEQLQNNPSMSIKLFTVIHNLFPSRSMEEEFLTHPGSVLVGEKTRKRPTPVPDSGRKRPVQPPPVVGSIRVPPINVEHAWAAVDTEEDFEPITPADMAVGAGIVPGIMRPPMPDSNQNFYPRDWVIDREKVLTIPTAQGDIPYPVKYHGYDPTKTGPRYGFGFHPESVLGPDWLSAYSLKIGLWFRNTVIDFARSLAGKLQYKSVNDVLETGFEDLHALIRQAQMDKTDLPALRQPEVSGTSVPDTTFAPAMGQAAPSKAMYELWSIAKMVSSFGTADDSIKFYRYLTHRTESRDAVYNRWLTLPMNLSQTYFTPVAKAGIEAAIDMIAQSFGNIPRENIFGEVLRSEARETFAELAALFIQRDRFTNPTGHHAKHTGENLESRISIALDRFSRMNLAPIRGPEDETSIQLNQEQRPARQLPAYIPESSGKPRVKREVQTRLNAFNFY